MTSKDRFVGRKEAALIAYKANQVNYETDYLELDKLKSLYSEDIY